MFWTGFGWLRWEFVNTVMNFRFPQQQEFLRQLSTCQSSSETSVHCWYLLTYLLTYSMVRNIIWKADCHSAYKKSWFLCATRSFITVFTKSHHWTLSWASWIQFAPSISISLRSRLMLFSHLRQGLPSGLYLVSFSLNCRLILRHSFRFIIVPHISVRVTKPRRMRCKVHVAYIEKQETHTKRWLVNLMEESVWEA
jgi:hypothetical protein